MKKQVFIGIDVSKKKLDVSFLAQQFMQNPKHFIVDNNEKGIHQMISKIEKQIGIEKDKWLICFEDTGVYSMSLALFLSETGLTFCQESSLRIKRSLGIKRGKNDKLDSKEIMQYAEVFQHKLRLSHFPKKELQELKFLLSHRERLMKQKHGLKVSSNEAYECFRNETTTFILEESKELLKHYDCMIDKVETKIKELVQKDEELKSNFDLATSVVGINLIITCYMMVQTNNFTSFNQREYACHAGVAPFEHSSGTSIPQKGKTSKMANKKIKALLTNGAFSAIRFDPQLKLYYRRKRDEGKNAYCVLNAIRFKLIARVFATVKRGTPYVRMAH